MVMIIKNLRFPATEVHTKFFVPPNDKDKLLYIFKSEDDTVNDQLMRILQAASLLEKTADVDLLLPYLPYSRMDRPIPESGDPFSLKIYGDLLNTAKFSKVYTLDVHSDVAYACVDNLVNINIKDIINIGYPKDHEIYDKTLVIPDQGAAKRLYTLKSDFDNSVMAVKHRDTNDGSLKIECVVGDVKDRDCIIVDDICDGGGTFVLLANELYKRGAKSIELWVTHGIFSKGLDHLYDAGINKIRTTDETFDGVNDQEEASGDLNVVYRNGSVLKTYGIQQIRNNITKDLQYL